MATFFIITGMILWVLATLGLLFGTIGAGIDVESLGEGLVVWIGGFTLVAASTAGIILTIDSNGWFDDGLPPDGCYQVTRDRDYIPVQTGKVITPVPVEDVQFIPISCP